MYLFVPKEHHRGFQCRFGEICSLNKCTATVALFLMESVFLCMFLSTVEVQLAVGTLTNPLRDKLGPQRPCKAPRKVDSTVSMGLRLTSNRPGFQATPKGWHQVQDPWFLQENILQKVGLLIKCLFHIRRLQPCYFFAVIFFSLLVTTYLLFIYYLLRVVEMCAII